MYVRKFEADTLEEALKEIKQELGPDAIILKTITNKGLKGAFKKKKIEITAAISEKNYSKKSVVDNAVGDMKEKFYSGPASYISNMIDSHTQNSKANVKSNNSGYGPLGLNRSVNQIKKDDTAEKSNLSIGLDEFLKGDTQNSQKQNEIVLEKKIEEEYHQVAHTVPNTNNTVDQKKIEDLEKKIFDLSKRLEKIDRKEPEGIFQLRTTLRSLDISERYIQNIIKKAIFELDENAHRNADVVFEYALKEMLKDIAVDRPLFSKVSQNKPTITVLISEISSGQTSFMLKLGSLKKGSILLKNYSSPDEKSMCFTEKMFDMDIEKVNTISEMVSRIRSSTEKDASVFIDYRVGNQKDVDETKKFIEGLKRSFENVEVLITLSAIHSEMYNRKVITTYRTLANGLIVSHLDLCLNYGSIFNVSEENSDLPLKFFGTGKVVPDDIEAATPERILAGIFQFE